MFSKSFVIQAFIALMILASSLMSSVNAAPAPSRQFLFQPRSLYEKGFLLTSDLAIAPQEYERAALSADIGTADHEKRFGELLFLDLVDRG